MISLEAGFEKSLSECIEVAHWSEVKFRWKPKIKSGSIDHVHYSGTTAFVLEGEYLTTHLYASNSV
jgi:hypothetical protein